MKTILIIQLLFLPFFIFSQEIKTYKGNFKNGTAKYSYYENDNFERIYHGSFYYEGKASSSYYTFKTSIKGQYENNKKTGFWKYRYGNSIREGKYINGKLSGKWSEKIVTKKGEILKTSVKFKNGRLCGKFIFNYDDHWEESIGKYDIEGEFLYNFNGDLKITGKFDDEGLFHGKWIIEYIENKTPYKDIRKYKNGVLYWRLHRNMSTGEILDKYDKTSFVESYYNNLDTTTNISIINGEKYGTSKILKYLYLKNIRQKI